MKIDSGETSDSGEDMKITQPNLKTKQILNKKFNEYFDAFETPQANKVNSRIGISASVVKNKESFIKPFSNFMNSANPKSKIQRFNFAGVRNNKNKSSSLQKVIDNNNTGDSKNVRNSKGFNNHNKYKVKDSYRRIGNGYNFKQRKSTMKNRKPSDFKRKKRSTGSDASGSQKRKMYGYVGYTGTRKTASKSKVSENLGNFSQGSGSMIPQYPIQKQCKINNNKQMISRNSLQSRKNNYNPVKTPIKRPNFINQINTCKPAKKTAKGTQQIMTTFENIWSAYTNKELKRVQRAKDDNVNPLNLYQKFNQGFGVKSTKEISKQRVKRTK